MSESGHAARTVIDRLLYRAIQIGARVAGASVDEVLRSLAARESARREGERQRKLGSNVSRLSTRPPQADDDDIVAFARAEVTVDDPLRTFQAEPRDAHGVVTAFARPVE